MLILNITTGLQLGALQQLMLSVGIVESLFLLSKSELVRRFSAIM